MAYMVRPLRKPAGQGSSANFGATVAAPIQPDYPHDTFKAPKSAEFNTSIVGPGAGTRGESGVVRRIPPRCC
jgi:hypothetical protein